MPGRVSFPASAPIRRWFVAVRLLRPQTVLLVEHEGPVRAYLEQQLADDGFEVLAADRSVQALDLAEEVKPDLVLLDAVLPDG